MEPYRAAAGPWLSRKGEWRDEVIRSGRYGPVTESRFEHTQHLSGKGFVDMVSSWSWIANLEERERTEVLERVREMVGDQLALQYETALYVLRLR